MKKDLCEIILILDESGSMESCKRDTIGAVNQFISTQKKIKGEARLTLVKFSDYYKVVNDAIDLSQAEELNESNYIPSFSTALLDAVGKTIDNTGRRLASTPEEMRPEKVIFAIITDGYENASKEFTQKQIFDMVSHQKEMYSWEFIFLGADIDAWGEEIGITNNYSFAREALPETMKRVSNFFANERSGGPKKTFKSFFDPSDDELDNL
jgi:hypothetical protein